MVEKNVSPYSTQEAEIDKEGPNMTFKGTLPVTYFIHKILPCTLCCLRKMLSHNDSHQWLKFSWSSPFLKAPIAGSQAFNMWTFRRKFRLEHRPMKLMGRDVHHPVTYESGQYLIPWQTILCPVKCIVATNNYIFNIILFVICTLIILLSGTFYTLYMLT